MLKVVKHQVIAGQQIKLKVVNYSRLRPIQKSSVHDAAGSSPFTWFCLHLVRASVEYSLRSFQVDWVTCLAVSQRSRQYRILQPMKPASEPEIQLQTYCRSDMV